MTQYPKLDQQMGLHQEIMIYYTVMPRYLAALYYDDGGSRVAEGTGDSIDEALAALEQVIPEAHG